jgi:molybdate transport system ATP-binding protein
MTVELACSIVRGEFRSELAVRIAAPATGIFGPSGAGKSTILQVLSGLLRPTSGRVLLAGEVLDDVAAGIHVPPHRRGLGMVFQHGHLFPHRDVAANLRYGERLRAGRRPMATFDTVVEILDLGALLTRRPDSLSGGERQRVALGRALLSAPRVLVLDEPLAALDPALKRQILPFLREIRRAFALPTVHVSHDLGELLQLTDDLLLLSGGRVVAQGDLVTLASNSQHLERLHEHGLVNVLAVTVTGHDADDGLTRVQLAGGAEAAVALQSIPLGTACDILVRPDDIVLAVQPVTGLSLQNRVAGQVRQVTHAPGRALVTVDIGCPLLVAVSPRAVRELELVPGRAVWCLFKAQAPWLQAVRPQATPPSV